MADAQIAQPPTAGAILNGTESRRPALPTGPAEFVFSSADSANTQDRNGKRFQVRGFEFSGNEALSRGRLRGVVERFLDLELNFYDLKKAADAVTAAYRNAGYPVAIAVIPAQRIQDGVVRIEVIEGRLGRLTFEGARRYPVDFLDGYVRDLRSRPVLSMAQLERSLLLLNDLPGLGATVTLGAGAKRGETDATIAITESPIRLAVVANNSGRDEAGSSRADIALELNGLLGHGDQLVYRTMQAEQGLLNYQQVKFGLPIGSDGWRVSASQSTAQYRMAGQFSALEIKGDVTSNELSLTYPWVRSRIRNIVVSAGWREVNTRQSALSTPIVANQISLATLGSTASWVHADSSATTASAVFTSNFRDNNHNQADSVLGKLDLDVTHLTGVAPRWDFYFHGNGVASASSLPDSEKFSIGGADSVRGFRSAELRGDRGYVANFEFRRQLMVGSKTAVASVFYDYGAVTNLGFAGEDVLASSGVGLTVYPTSNTRLKLDVAWPERQQLAVDPGKSPRVWASASISF
jgi:hemolysin activation/secretion protein